MNLLARLGYRTITPRELILYKRGDGVELPARPVLLTFDDGSQTVVSAALPILKSLGFVATVFMVVDRFGQPLLWDRERASSAHRLLTEDELKGLIKDGWDVGSHTLTHPRLSGLPPPDQWREIAESKRRLENVIGGEVTSFAYPYGDYNEALKNMVNQAGYQIGFATESGAGDLMAVPRRTIRGHVLRFFWRLHQALRMSVA